MKRNKTRTVLSLLLATLFIISVLSGCGKTISPDTPTTPGTSTTSADPSTSVVPDPVVDLPDEKYTFEWSDGGTKNGVTFYGTSVFTDYVTQETNGNIDFNLHFESELFGPPVEIEAIKSGEIDFAGVHHAFAGSISPLIEFLSGVGARGVFDSLEHYWRFIDTPEIRKMIEDEMAAKFNCKLLWLAPVSNPIIASTKPIHTVEDFQGLQLRTPGTASANAYSLLGASPVSLSASELYMGLERGVIQAADTGSDEVFYKSFYEVTPFLTVDYTVYSPTHLSVSILTCGTASPRNISRSFLRLLQKRRSSPANTSSTRMMSLSTSSPRW